MQAYLWSPGLALHLAYKKAEIDESYNILTLCGAFLLHLETNVQLIYRKLLLFPFLFNSSIHMVHLGLLVPNVPLRMHNPPQTTGLLLKLLRKVVYPPETEGGKDYGGLDLVGSRE